jgi:hypothetical protein
MAQIAASQGAEGNQLLDAAQKLIPVATKDFSTISTAAITVATNYPQSFG